MSGWVTVKTVTGERQYVCVCVCVCVSDGESVRDSPCDECQRLIVISTIARRYTGKGRCNTTRS